MIRKLVIVVVVISACFVSSAAIRHVRKGFILKREALAAANLQFGDIRWPTGSAVLGFLGAPERPGLILVFGAECAPCTTAASYWSSRFASRTLPLSGPILLVSLDNATLAAAQMVATTLEHSHVSYRMTRISDGDQFVASTGIKAMPAAVFLNSDGRACAILGVPDEPSAAACVSRTSGVGPVNSDSPVVFTSSLQRIRTDTR